VEGAGDHTAPSIGYRWVKANVYSALITAVLTFALYGLRQVLAVGDPQTATPAKVIFVITGSIVTALALAIFARLTGAVLARKLGSFPSRAWTLLHVFIGLTLGAMISAGDMGSVEVEAELDADAMVGTAALLMIIGVLGGAAFGSLQAFVLRKAARNVRVWIGYSTLGGIALGIAALTALYGPQSGFVSEVTSQIVSAVATVMFAVILLPAVRRLEPRNLSPEPVTPPPS
jgi:hypothetical protein